VTGITADELRGMLVLRRAQLEQELEAQKNQLLEVETRLSYIEREGTMPADDITVKAIPAMGMVAIAGPAPAFGAENVVPVVNRGRRPRRDRTASLRGPAAVHQARSRA
jgi:hypothetical protein